MLIGFIVNGYFYFYKVLVRKYSIEWKWGGRGNEIKWELKGSY